MPGEMLDQLLKQDEIESGAMTGLIRPIFIFTLFRAPRLGENRTPRAESVGDSYDDALAETINGPIKAEVIHRRGPWRSVEVWNRPRWNGWTGSTTAACLSASEASRP